MGAIQDQLQEVKDYTSSLRFRLEEECRRLKQKSRGRGGPRIWTFNVLILLPPRADAKFTGPDGNTRIVRGGGGGRVNLPGGG